MKSTRHPPDPTEVHTTEALRFAPDILQRLGEELVQHPDAGVIELVKNAYDADATLCILRLESSELPGGTLRLTDNGRGMDLDQIRAGWLVLGRSGKSDRQPTLRGRTPAGDKGLGRLAALRLGARAILRSRPASEPGVEFELVLDWEQYAASKVVEQVPLSIVRRSTAEAAGTEIVIEALRKGWTTTEVERLARSLLLLSSPFGEANGFRAELVAPEFKAIEARVRQAYFDAASLCLRARVEGGNAEFELFDSGGALLEARSPRPFQGPEAKLEFWHFVLDRKEFLPSGVGQSAVKQWLLEFGGVHVYHRGLRVPPYADKGDDWLGLNLARARSPADWPSTNTCIGRLQVQDTSTSLLQKTDRAGFVENEAFSGLRRFVLDAVGWLANYRGRHHRKARGRSRTEGTAELQNARTALDRAVAELPSEERSVVQPVLEAAKVLEAASVRVVGTAQEDIELYRTLGTVGIVSATFAHETNKPILKIRHLAERIDRSCQRLRLFALDPQLQSELEGLRRSADAMARYSEFPLGLLDRRKRRASEFDIWATCRATLDRLRPFVTDSGGELLVDLPAEPAFVRGTVSSVEAILTNLVLNASAAIGRSANAGDRAIDVRGEVSPASALLVVADSGDGIQGIETEDIWLPGRTTLPDGTGLGLTIVKDCVEDLSGAVEVRRNGDRRGAEFRVSVPLWRLS